MFFCEKYFHIETITIPVAEYKALKALIVEQQQQIQEQREQIVSLQEQIRLLKNGRKSTTSSTPPSQDIGRSNQKSLREKSPRNSGGQPGHEGATLQMKENPDKVKEHRPVYCEQCGEALPAANVELVSRKQEIVLPPIEPQYIEHQSYACTCARCGFVTTAKLPAQLKANVQYGAQVEAWVAYLSVRQYMSYKRIAEFMKDCMNLPISEGTVDNMLQKLTEKAQGIYEEIKQRVEQSLVVGGDETGIKINGKKGWLWAFQTTTLTFLSASMNRGFETISRLFKNGFSVSVYVTDCLAAQLKVAVKARQICTAHLLRELNNFIETFACQWSVTMKQLLLDAIELKSKLTPQDYLHPNENVVRIQCQLDELLQTELLNKHKKLQTFIKRLHKNHDAILTFLYYPKVPPDNNGSERAIRNAKVKMKVSGQFKAFAGAHRFAVLRSIIDTAIKNSQNVLDALCLLSKMPATC